MELVTVPVGPLQCNCYVLWKRKDAAVVIDPGDEADRLRAKLGELGVTPRLILNTHGHFDHIGAVEALKKDYGAPYKVHRGEVEIMAMVPARTRLWGILTPEAPTPDAFVEHGETFDVGGLRLEAIHTPGHTPGSTSFHAPGAQAIFTGDTLFLGSIGRSDFPGGNGPQLIRSIKERLLALPGATRVYPGHGPASTIGDEAEQNPFLV